MPPRILASLAQALSAAANLDGAFLALAGGVGELQREGRVALLPFDAKTGLIRERLAARGGRVERVPLEIAFGQFAPVVARTISQGGLFADFGEESAEFARLLALASDEPCYLAVRGLRVDGQLAALVAIVEPREGLATRLSERAGAAVALFELAFLRFAEREGRNEAVRTLEDVTQRVHGDYVTRLAALEGQLRERPHGEVDDPGTVARERTKAKLAEEGRRSTRHLAALEHQLTAAIGQLEQAHVELHRRGESLRQRTRTLYLLERVLLLASESQDPRRLAEGLLALVGDDMQALRCSLFLCRPGDANTLYLVAGRGLAPHVTEGARIRVGQGVAGRVAETREPLLVVDVRDAAVQPLLGDEYLTTGSFISFPLVLHGALIGVVNLTNRAQRGLFVEEDVERVRLLGLVISLVAREADLSRRLLGVHRDRSTPT